MINVLPDAVIRIGGHGLSKVVPLNGLNDRDNLLTPKPEFGGGANCRARRRELIRRSKRRFDRIKIMGRLQLFRHDIKWHHYGVLSSGDFGSRSSIHDKRAKARCLFARTSGSVNIRALVRACRRSERGVP